MKKQSELDACTWAGSDGRALRGWALVHAARKIYKGSISFLGLLEVSLFAYPTDPRFDSRDFSWICFLRFNAHPGSSGHVPWDLQSSCPEEFVGEAGSSRDKGAIPQKGHVSTRRDDLCRKHVDVDTTSSNRKAMEGTEWEAMSPLLKGSNVPLPQGPFCRETLFITDSILLARWPPT